MLRGGHRTDHKKTKSSVIELVIVSGVLTVAFLVCMCRAIVVTLSSSVVFVCVCCYACLSASF